MKFKQNDMKLTTQTAPQKPTFISKKIQKFDKHSKEKEKLIDSHN